MIKSIKKGFLSFLGIVFLLLTVIVIENFREAKLRDRKYDANRLSAKDKRLIKETLILKRKLGDNVWPTLSKAKIPVILYNDKYEFLINDSALKGWSTVNDRIDKSIYFRKTLDNLTQEIIPLDDKWAGCLAIYDRLNRDNYLKIRKELPPFINQIYPYQYASFSYDLYIVNLLNEIFSAYQAHSFPIYYKKAVNSYKYEDLYPYENQDFSNMWNKEGFYLWKAANSNQIDSVRNYTQKFLNIRDNRRKVFSLSPHLISFEKNIEWLEGLPKYAEIKFYMLSAKLKPDSSLIYFYPDPTHFDEEYKTLKKDLGRQNDDYLLCLSGMAQAQILDKLLPEWKIRFNKKHSSLEDLLRVVVRQQKTEEPNSS